MRRYGLRAIDHRDLGVVDAQVRDDLEQLGEAVVAMHQRLQGSPMGPPPLSLMGRRRG